MAKWIWFDMDGTIADLYGYKGWLDCLMAHDVKPYAKAKPLYDVYELFETLVALHDKGYKLGIISWGSKERNADYDKAVAKAKMEWLFDYMLDMVFDKIIVTAYGIKKADTCRKYGSGVLVDDEIQNREAWDLGDTIDANEDILERLRALI